MKKRTFLLAMAGMAISGAEILKAQTASSNKKSLIAYFSRRGYNYRDGEIVFLEVGNTEVVAQKLQALSGSDLFQIETVKSYPEGYHETTEEAKKELNENARPELQRTVENINDYDVIYLGYPNWWGTMPMAVHTFLESFNSEGKTIIPFCTHEGSRLGSSEKDIKKLCPKAKVLQGLAIKGGHVGLADMEIEQWYKRNL